MQAQPSPPPPEDNKERLQQGQNEEKAQNHIRNTRKWNNERSKAREEKRRAKMAQKDSERKERDKAKAERNRSKGRPENWADLSPKTRKNHSLHTKRDADRKEKRMERYQ